jgi:F-box/WD-40 domain protein MET30
MERSGSSTLTSSRHNDTPRRVNDVDSSSMSLQVESSEVSSNLHPISNRNHDRIRPEDDDRSRLTNMSPTLISKTVTPFLREYIPGAYAPIGKPENQEISRIQDPNSKYCYRHRPDLKCRRAADETKMVKIQSVRYPVPIVLDTTSNGCSVV